MWLRTTHQERSDRGDWTGEGAEEGSQPPLLVVSMRPRTARRRRGAEKKMGSGLVALSNRERAAAAAPARASPAREN